MSPSLEPALRPAGGAAWRRRWFQIIFGHATPAGRAFDLVLIVLILASVAIALLDTVPSIHERAARVLYAVEWGFTLLFTVEYATRLAVVARPMRYARSFFGVVDLLAVLPTYLSVLLPGAQYLLVVRVLRILRVFRILKLIRYVDEAGVLITALSRARRKIFVFVFAVGTLVVVFGALMYLIEGPQNGFTSIPLSMYWAVVTMATVGFGDITPATPLGRFVTSILILIGYGLIAVPTGIYAAELTNTLRTHPGKVRCPRCRLVGHESDAIHCRRCGSDLKTPASEA
ncbi:MAG TPA: ion transporter [Xanthomonadaceae bacterium]|nr:ion transporter [Xanthomonadaceae bacterium]